MTELVVQPDLHTFTFQLLMKDLYAEDQVVHYLFQQKLLTYNNFQTEIL